MERRLHRALSLDSLSKLLRDNDASIAAHGDDRPRFVDAFADRLNPSIRPDNCRNSPAMACDPERHRVSCRPLPEGDRQFNGLGQVRLWEEDMTAVTSRGPYCVGYGPECLRDHGVEPRDALHLSAMWLDFGMPDYVAGDDMNSSQVRCLCQNPTIASLPKSL